MDRSLYHSEAAKLLLGYTGLEQQWDQAREALQKHVLDLLENDLPALYQLLYTVDIDERKAREAFGADSQSIAGNLTVLIMDRILQKAESRVKYKP